MSARISSSSLGAIVTRAISVWGLLVLLVGNGINFAMGLMSGVVHGLRLNLIEFFNWSLPEEGEEFHAFEKKALKAAE